MPNSSFNAERFVTLLDLRGLPEALRYLNSGVLHRYTAIYGIHGALLKNLFLVDKRDEVTPEFLAEVPMGDSFCQFVLRDGCFLTENSAEDRRLDGHPYQGVMVSYHGVPLTRNSGEVWGTLCHFDVERQPFSEAAFEQLQKAARLIPYQ